MENKMSPAPWKIKATPSQTGGALSDANGNMFLRVYSSSNTKEQDASAIVSAINNTYGKGIDPSSVPDLLEALKQARFYLSKHPEIDTLCEDAINKAVIKK
jgi:hypothetical protein